MNQVPIIAQKGTILIPSGPVNHLHIVCSDPVLYPKTGKESVLLVNVTSIKNEIQHDTSCVLHPDDHPFIKHPSYVYYRKADIFGVERIAMGVASGDLITHKDFSINVFTRVLRGFSVSDEVKLKVFRFYEKYCK